MAILPDVLDEGIPNLGAIFPDGLFIRTNNYIVVFLDIPFCYDLV